MNIKSTYKKRRKGKFNRIIEVLSSNGDFHCFMVVRFGHYQKTIAIAYVEVKRLRSVAMYTLRDGRSHQ